MLMLEAGKSSVLAAMESGCCLSQYGAHYNDYFIIDYNVKR